MAIHVKNLWENIIFDSTPIINPYTIICRQIEFLKEKTAGRLGQDSYIKSNDDWGKTEYCFSCDFFLEGVYLFSFAYGTDNFECLIKNKHENYLIHTQEQFESTVAQIFASEKAKVIIREVLEKKSYDDGYFLAPLYDKHLRR